VGLQKLCHSFRFFVSLNPVVVARQRGGQTVLLRKVFCEIIAEVSGKTFAAISRARPAQPFAYAFRATRGPGPPAVCKIGTRGEGSQQHRMALFRQTGVM
jgi:hypothetical protein